MDVILHILFIYFIKWDSKHERRIISKGLHSGVSLSVFFLLSYVI